VKASVSCESQSEPRNRKRSDERTGTNAGDYVILRALLAATEPDQGPGAERAASNRRRRGPERVAFRPSKILSIAAERLGDFASTLARSVLRKRTSAGKSTGVAVLNMVGGAHDPK